MQGGYRRDFQHIAGRQQQAEFAAEANHPAAEPRREQLCRLFRRGDARPRQVRSPTSYPHEGRREKEAQRKRS